jgi:hypothetical protein
MAPLPDGHIVSHSTGNKGRCRFYFAGTRASGAGAARHPFAKMSLLLRANGANRPGTVFKDGE